MQNVAKIIKTALIAQSFVSVCDVSAFHSVKVAAN